MICYYFLCSGYLVTFRVLNNLSRGFDCWILIRFYISRYLRLFPVYMIVLGIYATLTKYISSGPLWPQDEVMLGNCSHLAWSNAFYINNYIHPEQMVANNLLDIYRRFSGLSNAKFIFSACHGHGTSPSIFSCSYLPL